MKLFQYLALASIASAASLPPRNALPKAVYFMSNKDGANSIHALPVDATGMVGHGTVTKTGGKGSRAPSMFGLTDALNSQGSLALAGNASRPIRRLYVVNAGSNTISVLEIDSADPLKLTPVCTPVGTLGDWPNALVVSDELETVCVSNSGTTSGISCFKMTDSGLENDGEGFRPLTLIPKQTTPPQGPFNTVSQVFFSQDLSALYATVKGTPATNASNTGYLSYFPIAKGTVSTKETRSSPAGTAVLFGSVALPNRRILATDASFGSVLLSVDATGVATTLNKVAIPHNGATCWAAQSPATGLIYTTDDGVDQVAALNPANGNMVALTPLTNGNPNMIEINAIGDMFYALSHGNVTIPPHVVVMKTLGNGTVQAIQNFAPNGVGINVEGMAVLA